MTSPPHDPTRKVGLGKFGPLRPGLVKAMTRRTTRPRGAVIGLVSAGLALGVGELVAALVRPDAAPAIAVGNRVIRLTPEPVKRWAIRTFGTADKIALLSGIYAVIAVCALGIGVLAARRLWAGLAGIAVFGALGSYCALTAPASRSSDLWPTVAGTAAASAVMVWLSWLGERSKQSGATETGGAGPAGGPDRRRFLLGAASTGALAVVGGYLGRVLQGAWFDVSAARARVALPAAAEPAADASGTSVGLGVPWQTSNGAFYRIDTALRVPQIDPASWRLRLHGMVDREIVLTYDDLLARPLIERWITLCCVSNEVGGGLIGNARFLGARLADLLREAGIHRGADQLLLSSSDGMTIGAPTAVILDGRDALIAVGMNGTPLPFEHGFPARIVVPGLYGYTSACKWVVDIEATTFQKRQAYWVQGGWDAQTDIKTASRIDTPRNGASVRAGQTVPIAGVAWDQHVGVDAVEVQVNDGPWMPARLARVPSTDTWRQWILDWTPPRTGSHTLRVRAHDGAGLVQTSAARDVFPSGATGLHTITVRAV